MSTVEVRRFLHVNYNCTDLDALERFYVEILGLKTVMRTGSTGADGRPFGYFGQTAADAAFVYDHRGGRRSNSLELVEWIDPATIGAVYPDPWYRGIQSVGYSAADLDAVTECAVELGGSLVRRGDAWLLVKDPEGVSIEVHHRNGPSEGTFLRVVCSDLDRTSDWWSGLGFHEATLPSPPVDAIWPGDGERVVTAEKAMVPTDDSDFGIVLTTWSGPTPVAPTYGMPFHQGLFRMAMAVDDVHTAFDSLLEMGIARQNVSTFQLPGTKLADGLTMLFIRDPDGIVVELVERPRQT